MIKVIQVGLGPIGLSSAKLILAKKSLKLVGAVDIRPEMEGMELGKLLGKRNTGIKVTRNVRELIRRKQPEFAVITTTSFTKGIASLIETFIENKVSVVSSCEELLDPYLQSPTIARKLHHLALKHNVRILGTGINPGFIMETLPAFISTVCIDVQKVAVYRYLDAGKRRLPLQKKVGAGLSRKEFSVLAKKGKLGHIGLRESVSLLGKALDFKLTKISQELKPAIAPKSLKTKFLTVKKGQAAGIINLAYGLKGTRKLIHLDLRMYVGCPNPKDEIKIFGNPNLQVNLSGGVPGDSGTVATLVNNIPRLLLAPPGLRTMGELVPHLIR